MRHFQTLGLALVMCLAASSGAWAECYADYKAKKDQPLQLHYGVAQLPNGACDAGTAQAQLSARLAAQGWTLLNILSIFGPEGLAERKANAGQWFLRF